MANTTKKILRDAHGRLLPGTKKPGIGNSWSRKGVPKSVIEKAKGHTFAWTHGPTGSTFTLDKEQTVTMGYPSYKKLLDDSVKLFLRERYAGGRAARWLLLGVVLDELLRLFI